MISALQGTTVAVSDLDRALDFFRNAFGYRDSSVVDGVRGNLLSVNRGAGLRGYPTGVGY